MRLLFFVADASVASAHWVNLLFEHDGFSNWLTVLSNYNKILESDYYMALKNMIMLMFLPLYFFSLKKFLMKRPNINKTRETNTVKPSCMYSL